MTDGFFNHLTFLFMIQSLQIITSSSRLYSSFTHPVTEVVDLAVPQAHWMIDLNISRRHTKAARAVSFHKSIVAPRPTTVQSPDTVPFRGESLPLFEAMLWYNGPTSHIVVPQRAACNAAATRC